MVGFQPSESSSMPPSPGESIIVVMDANRSKGSLDALEWAINTIVHPNDTVVVLGVLTELGKKPSQTSCFPFIGTVWVKLEFSAGQGEMSPSHLAEEIVKKREEYLCALQPFYRQCKKNGVKLDVQLAAGIDPRNIAVEEAHKCNPRWIVLDSHLKKDKVYIYGHVACNVAVMKGKIGAVMHPKAPECEQWGRDYVKIKAAAFTSNEPGKHQDESSADLKTLRVCSPPPTPQNPCWCPLSWRTGFPRAFSVSELEVITNCFANENIVQMKDDWELFEGVYLETPVLVMRHSVNDDRAWSLLKILSRVRHRCVFNLVGYCCSGDFMFLLRDYPCSSTLERNLQSKNTSLQLFLVLASFVGSAVITTSDESAKSLPWKVRWQIALDIGTAVRYLHEECADGPIVDLSVCSTHIVMVHGVSAMNEEEDVRLSGDVRDYGMLLIELISGKSAEHFQEQGEGQSLIDWALPQLENGSLSQVMDPRLTDASGDVTVHHMQRAALLCLKNGSGQKYSMSEVLAVVRGDQYKPDSILVVSSVTTDPQITFNYLHLLAATALIVAVYCFYIRSNSIYLIDFSCYLPPDHLRVPTSEFIEHFEICDIHQREAVDFQAKVIERSGVGGEAGFPLAVHQIPPDTSLNPTREETETILFTIVKDLLTKNNVNPKSIDIVVSNCSIFCPTPSITAMIINKFGLRSNVKSISLSGMGCSAGLLSISLAKDLLRVHRNSLALVLSMEAVTLNGYTGGVKSMLLANALFRMGGVAALLSNRNNDKGRARYKLQYLVRTHMGSDDQSYLSVFQEHDECGHVGVSLSKVLLHVAGNALKTNISELGPSVLLYSEQFLYGWYMFCSKYLGLANSEETYVPNFKKAFEHFCIHAGGRAVIDAVEDNLRLSKEDGEASRMTLYRFGNTSSSSVWYELCYLESKGRVKKGDRLWQIAFGSGFKCNSAVWKCISEPNPNLRNAWADRIHLYPVEIPNVAEH
ncbi:hypothetical protein RJ639_010969 [Escallonia herrerae]|uniref:very-long-chain 3-oxoacyl-CoA synthase n=1 Tax=Escallonia herrerae TaxID=1293975 RepID=A0AA88VM23_9ASTE|nr:hypothetical protein RJ639_010969 [Escallonia herrerae]